MCLRPSKWHECVFFCSGGHQTGLPQHLQDHGLRGLLQMSTVGETAGQHTLTTLTLMMFSKGNSVICGWMLNEAVEPWYVLYSLFWAPCFSRLQTQGLGTSLKILFSERQIEALHTSSDRRPSFQLSRQEVVSLLNAFGRWASLSASRERRLCSEFSLQTGKTHKGLHLHVVESWSCPEQFYYLKMICKCFLRCMFWNMWLRFMPYVMLCHLLKWYGQNSTRQVYKNISSMTYSLT